MSDPRHTLRDRHGAPDQTAAAKPIPASEVPSRPVRVRESLSADAQALLRRLSPELAMTATARDFPHVMNRIAIVFGDATAFEQVMWGLLIDDRPIARGFRSRWPTNSPACGCTGWSGWAGWRWTSRCAGRQGGRVVRLDTFRQGIAVSIGEPRHEAPPSARAADSWNGLVPMDGLELSTFALRMRCSTN